MSLRQEIHDRRDAVTAIGARYGVSRIRLFGSVVREQERPGSDIDLLVHLDENCGFEEYLGFVEDVEKLLGRAVDVVIDRSLSRHFRPYIEAEAEPL
jgi:predicted nucleotidyltransferase